MRTLWYLAALFVASTLAANFAHAQEISPEQLRALQNLMDRAGEPAPGTSMERFQRLLAAAEYLAAHIHEAPVWIVPCLQGETPTRTAGSSIYPAVQNLLLACRAVGLGGQCPWQ